MYTILLGRLLLPANGTVWLGLQMMPHLHRKASDAVKRSSPSPHETCTVKDVVDKLYTTILLIYSG
jgi:hypothetical protein